MLYNRISGDTHVGVNDGLNQPLVLMLSRAQSRQVMDLREYSATLILGAVLYP
jgi:hypothetical protein